jgi:transposase
MLMLKANSIIYVSLLSVDMRKSINGLSMLIVSHLQSNPQSGDLFLFCNRGKDKVKALYWDRNGFVLFYKQLEKDKFKFPLKHENGHIEISQKELSWLLAGFNFTQMSAHPELDFTDYF